jgi:exopolyphosphatase / guanosine-5'-triphosphate,3'-diphosphate pyrophosphatase
MKVAIVDIGTNSTRLLIAEVRDGVVEELDRRTTVTRLGEGLEASGRLSDVAMSRVSDALASYREAIDSHGAERVVAVATRSSAASAWTRARSRATRRRG